MNRNGCFGCQNSTEVSVDLSQKTLSAHHPQPISQSALHQPFFCSLSQPPSKTFTGIRSATISPCSTAQAPLARRTCSRPSMETSTSRLGKLLEGLRCCPLHQCHFASPSTNVNVSGPLAASKTTGNRASTPTSSSSSAACPTLPATTSP